MNELVPISVLVVLLVLSGPLMPAFSAVPPQPKLPENYWDLVRGRFAVGQKEAIVWNCYQDMDVAPFVEGGRVYVPLRYLAHSVGVRWDLVVWLPEEETAVLTDDNVCVLVKVGSPELFTFRGTDAEVFGRILWLDQIREQEGEQQMMDSLVWLKEYYPDFAEKLDSFMEKVGKYGLEWLLNQLFSQAVVKMDVVPVIKNGRVFLPARYIAQAFGFKVVWYEEGGIVYILEPASYK